MRVRTALVAAGMAIVVLMTTAGDQHGLVTLRSGEAGELCLGADPAAGRRPVLAVHAVTGEVGALAVTAATGEEMLVGLYPGGPFMAAHPGEVRRSFLQGEGSRCWTVTLMGEGTATVSVELSDPLDQSSE